MPHPKEETSSNKLYWFYLVGFFLILLLPLLVLPPWFTPIGWGKTIVFRIILSVLVFLFLGQILYKKVDIFNIKNKIKSISPAFWLLVALFFIYLLATIFSFDPHFSLWGDPFRSGGFLNFSFYILFAIFAFLIIQQKDWQKLLDFALIIGILASVIAIFQQFGIYSKFFIPFTVRPGGPVGNPIFLATYLLLLTFPSLSFFSQSKNLVKKIFYSTSILLFLFVVLFLTQSRGAFLGLAVGFLWFLFAYPKKIKTFKISAAILLILLTLGMYSLKAYLDSHLDIYQKIPPLISSTLDRALSIFETTKIGESRISSWKVALQALKEKPILGWGPENFVIGFDKYYDPKLPRLSQGPEGGAEWWDRAHNFIFDISVTAGISALLIYLSFFGVLLWQLQKIKRYNPNPAPEQSSVRGRSTNSSDAIVAHGIQATFLGYLTAIFFSFDWFETYLIFFLLIGFSFHLISNYNPNLRIKSEPRTSPDSVGTVRGRSTNKKFEIVSHKLYKYRTPIVVFLFLLFFWFFWVFNLKPLKINKELNMAVYYVQEAKIKNCQKALEIVDKISPINNIIDNYVRVISAVEIIHNCTNEDSSEELTKKAIQILEKNIKNHPAFTQNWLLLAEYTNILIEEKIKLSDNVFVPTEEMVKLKNEANYYFEEAVKLSPKRQEIFREWLKIEILTGEYEKAEERAQKCIDLNPNYGGCYWLMALTQGYLGNSEELSSFTALAQEKGYNTESEESLPQLINMYIRTGNYQGLAETYPKLIEIISDRNKKAQLHASLAVVYKELGEIEKARETALKALELQPEAREIVEEFLKTLEQ